MFRTRLKFVAAVVFALMVVVLARLAWMQIFRCADYRRLGIERQIHVDHVAAARGLVVARDGTVLAEDRPARNVCVTLSALRKMDDWELCCWYARVAAVAGDTPEGVEARVASLIDAAVRRVDATAGPILGKEEETLDRRLKLARAEARNIVIDEFTRKKELYQDVDFATAVRAEVASAELPGLSVTQSMKRKYPAVQVGDYKAACLAPHAVGYVGMSTSTETELYALDYLGDELKRVGDFDVMGRGGVEKQYNFELRGRLGRKVSVVNNKRKVQKIVEDLPAEIGATLRLSIDPVIQAAAEQSLSAIFNSPDPAERHAGAAVCMDVATGEILALASSPSYDSNTFSKDYKALIDPAGLGKWKPLLNRVTAAGYPLGSVFKVVTATAGLESRSISPGTTFTCDGEYELRGLIFRCWIARVGGAHGPLDLCNGLKNSCNVYFYNTGRVTGGQELSKWARHCGFGESSGIDLPGEIHGNLPIPRYAGDVINLSIGQGRLLGTPLQACRMIAAVANGGRLVAPRLNMDAPVPEPRLVGTSLATIRTLQRGMYMAVNEPGGTGYRPVRSDVIIIAGKTGTAQAPPQGDQRGDHAWFAGYAPYEDPEVAFAVIIEHGGHGGETAGPVAKAIAEAYAKRKAGL